MVRLYAAIALLAGAAAQHGKTLLVGDLDTHAVLHFSSSGDFLGEFVKRRSGGLQSPGGLVLWSKAAGDESVRSSSNATDNARSLYVVSMGTNQILQYDGDSGRFKRRLCNVESPRDLVVHDDIMYVSSYFTDSIQRFRAATGSPLGYLAKGPPLAGPRDIHFHDNELLVASHFSGEILKYSANEAWSCPLTQSPCSKPPRSFTSVRLGSVASLSSGADRIFAVGPSLGGIFILNASTGEYKDHLVDAELSSERAPMDIVYAQGHLFVSTRSRGLRRYDAVTGESYGSFLAPTNALSHPNKLLWFD